MRYCIKIILVVIVCIVAVSCRKKPLSLEDPQPPNVEVHDSVMRLSAYYFYNISGSVQDTFRFNEIFYDGLGRVKTIRVYMNSPVPHSLFWITTFNYHDSESIAYEKIQRFPTMTGRDTLQTSFYYYDNLQRLIKDSINYPNQVEVTTYHYSSSMIIARRSYVFNTSPVRTTTEIDTGFLSGTGNMIKLVESYSIDSIAYKSTAFAYDDKPNPFYQLNIRSTFRPIFDINDLALHLDFYLQKNNIVRIVETDLSVPVILYNTDYSYSYNLAGFPVTQFNPVWRSDGSGNWVAYEYKKMH